MSTVPLTSSANEIDAFYTSLWSTMEQVPIHNLLVIAGDLNAKLGPDEAKFSFNSLFISNTSFMKPKGQLWTFEYPSGDRNQLDYLTFRKKWRNSVKDSRAFSSFALLALTI